MKNEKIKKTIPPVNAQQIKVKELEDDGYRVFCIYPQSKKYFMSFKGINIVIEKSGRRRPLNKTERYEALN